MIILCRIAENNLVVQRQDGERAVENVRDDLRRLKEDKLALQVQVEEGVQVHSDLQEQLVQLSKHVKTIPELRRDLNNLQNQRNLLDRRMKEQAEQTRGI